MSSLTNKLFRTTRQSESIEITNIADIALILAFLGLLTPHIVMISSTDLISSTGPSVDSAPRETLTIMLQADGTILLNRETISLENLKLLLERLKNVEKKPKIYLTGDRSAQLGLNIEIRGLLSGIDFTEIALQKE